jgi:hypothetical protein
MMMEGSEVVRTTSRKHIMTVAQPYAVKQQEYRDLMRLYQAHAEAERTHTDELRRRRRTTKMMQRASRSMRQLGDAIGAGFVAGFTSAAGATRNAADVMRTGYLQPSIEVEHREIPAIIFDEHPAYVEYESQVED